MRIFSKAYGEIEIAERQVIQFPMGLFGFEHLQRYALLDAAQAPFYWLQSLEDPEIAFVMMNPYDLRPDYVLDVPDADLDSIQFESDEDILVFAIVTIPDDPDRISANLQGPVMINRVHQLGWQSISLSPEWRTKHFILEELSKTETR
ncbi:MAG: flagellar assembly protein FliW [Spirochaetales bacterium]|nr:MAG: flagellar assembly protein FliW [Spirochaetales bacterium]